MVARYRRGMGWMLAFAFVGACGTPRPAVDARASVAQAGVPDVLAPAETGFAGLVERLSEPGGFFDSDNLISNETSYLHVLDAMRRTGVRGGAYVGVGPDQNFSYIAAVRPRIAVIVDIRRDNLLEHLLFKALFDMSRTRVEYLAHLVGRPVPRDLQQWRTRSIEEIVDYLDRTPSQNEQVARTQSEIDARVTRYGIPLDANEIATMRRIRTTFVAESLGIRYSSLGRAPRPYHPTYRKLLLERDRAGKQTSFLADEEAFQYVKRMQARNLVVPVVGNLAGDSALVRIARYLRERGDVVSAFYVSNVEQYLMRDGSFPRWIANIERFPHNRRSVIIRSFFGTPFGSAHPLNVAGHTSTSMLQTFDSLLAEYANGNLRSYFDLVGRNYLDP